MLRRNEGLGQRPVSIAAGSRASRRPLPSFIHRNLPLLLPLFFLPSFAKSFLTQEEALRLAFPKGAVVTRKTAFLSEADRAEVARRSGGAPPPGLVVYYVATVDGKDAGTAYFDTHVVRTLPETILVVVDPKGAIARIEVLSFSEPEEYLPRENWYGQFSGQDAERRALREEGRQARHGRDDHGARHRRGGAPRPRAGRLPEGEKRPEVKRWAVVLNHLACALVGLSGVAYGVMKYFLTGSDPDSRVGHPWQQPMLKAHVLAAPFLVFALGLVLQRPRARRLKGGADPGRTSGSGLLGLAAPLILTGAPDPGPHGRFGATVDGVDPRRARRRLRPRLRRAPPEEDGQWTRSPPARRRAGRRGTQRFVARLYAR